MRVDTLNTPTRSKSRMNQGQSAVIQLVDHRRATSGAVHCIRAVRVDSALFWGSVPRVEGIIEQREALSNR